jgi:tight adherence protein C
MDAELAQSLRTALNAIVAISVVATVYTLVSPMLEGDKLKKRMASVADTRETMRLARLDDLNKDKGLRQGNKGFVKNLVDGLSLEKLLEATDLRDKLAQAGLRGQRPMYTFYFARLILPIVGFILGLIFLIGLNVGGHDMVQRVGMTLGATLFGYYAPGIYLKNRASKRLKSIMPVFPDSLDLLLICVEAGMSAEMAFGRVATEMADSSVELAEEFSLTTAELSYLPSRRQAFENFARRNNHVGIKSVSTALVQAERYGTPLGDTLRTLANENREMRVLEAEKKAAALPAKLTVPMILFFLPVIFIVILTPAAMRISGSF